MSHTTDPHDALVGIQAALASCPIETPRAAARRLLQLQILPMPERV